MSLCLSIHSNEKWEIRILTMAGRRDFGPNEKDIFSVYFTVRIIGANSLENSEFERTVVFMSIFFFFLFLYIDLYFLDLLKARAH